MHILKVYGMKVQSDINNYDALKDKHAQSYFYGKCAKKQLKQLKKIIQFQPFNKKYYELNKLLVQKIAFVEDEYNILKNKEQQQKRKQLNKSYHSPNSSRKYIINKNNRSKLFTKTPDKLFYKEKPFNPEIIKEQSVQDSQKSIKIIKRNKSTLPLVSNLKFKLTPQKNKDDSLVKLKENLISKNKDQYRLDHDTFNNYMSAKRFQIMKKSPSLYKQKKYNSVQYMQEMIDTLI